MKNVYFTPEQLLLVEELVSHYISNQIIFKRFNGQLKEHFTDNELIEPFIHSLKWRVKDPEHLRTKLLRKLKECLDLSIPFDITKDNLFQKINDLAGFRIIHLHTQQFQELNKNLLAVFDEALITILEGPIAYTWDEENKAYFESVGVATKHNPRMYTSVHYVIQPNQKTKITAEIQIRTLAEELWGEVDHKINYPIPSSSLSCRDQIKVLARFTSGCSRLVDSIFLSNKEQK